MAVSFFKTTQYASYAFTESAGVVLFDPETNQICLLRHKSKNEWLLPKGRRDVGESRTQAALREVEEETGFRCRLLPIRMFSRQPMPTDPTDATDEAVRREGITEPFMCTVREMAEGTVKLIWWFVAFVDERDGKGRGEEQFEAAWFAFGDAVKRATFESDREVLRKGIELFKSSVTNVPASGSQG